MKTLLTIVLSLLLLPNGVAQDTTVVLSTRLFQSHQRLFLAPLNGWRFKPGNNPAWAAPALDATDWKPMNPTTLSPAMADPTGRVEGWFRIKVRLDSSFQGMPLALARDLWAATDVYVDGRLVHAFGKTGRPYEAYNPTLKYPTPITLRPGEEYVMAVHFVDYETTFTQREIRLKPQNLRSFLNLTGPDYVARVANDYKLTHIYGTLAIAVSFLLFFLFWLLVVLNPGQRIFWLIALLTTFVLLAAIGNFFGAFFELSYPQEKLRFVLAVSFQPIMIFSGLIVLEWVLTRRITWISASLLVLIVTTSTYAHLFSVSPPFGVALTAMLGYFGYLLVKHRRTISGAQWAVVGAVIVPTLAAVTYVNLHKYSLDLFYEYDKPITTLTFLGAPLQLLVYISIRFQEVLRDVAAEARKVLHVTEEKRAILANQNTLLETQVQERTAELNRSLDHLKATQAQLIQKEKLASLGELTAGIAHEIQNPLNFVNNFSEVSAELLAELEEERQKSARDPELEAELLGDLKQNLQKITHHGQRASGIVRGMLEHARSSTGERQPTDLNALADEYLRLAYHGFRRSGVPAKYEDFSGELRTDFAPDLPLVSVIPPDLGRVLLNLFNNAFYAIREKQKTAPLDYRPTVTVSTDRVGAAVEIRVRDNGTGIPESVKAKIFQPFFTTKPTGEGTGLGLSLSYDIITKGHGGSLTVSSSPNQSTEFLICLPT